MPQVTNVPTIATQYDLYDAVAIPGMPYGQGQPVVLPFTNMAGTKKARWTIAVPATVDANATYSLNVGGTVVAAVTGGATTQAQLSAMLLNAVRAGVAANAGLAITMAANLITIESMNVGAPLTVTSPSNPTTTNDLIVTQVVASGDDSVIPFGRFVGRQFDYPQKAAGLINSDSTTYAAGQDGFIVYGVTHTTQAITRVGRGLTAIGGYSPLDVMNIWTARGNAQGIWVETTAENDIKIGDTFAASAMFIATTAGNEGKLTKDDTTYDGVALNKKIEVLSDSILALGKSIALVTFDKLT
jgi:hypothetical protein